MSAIVAREYSKRLGVITPKQLQAALDRFDLGTLVSAEPAPGGLFGQNVMIESTTDRWVLRGAPHNAAQFARERYFSQLVHERTDIPAPVPYLIEESPDIFGWPYALMPWLDGTALTDDLQRSMNDDDRVAVAMALGEGLARLQQATWPEHAWYDDATGELRPTTGTYPDFYSGSTRYWLAQCRAASDATTDADVAWVESVIEAAREALAVPFQAAFVHTDYQRENVVAQRDAAGGWRVSGVFDLADCYMGDGEADLPRTYIAFQRKHPGAATTFARAYLAQRAPRAGFAERWRLYTLRDRLVFWEYGQRNNVWFPQGMTLRQWAGQYVEMPAPL